MVCVLEALETAMLSNPNPRYPCSHNSPPEEGVEVDRAFLSFNTGFSSRELVSSPMTVTQFVNNGLDKNVKRQNRLQRRKCPPKR